MEKRWMVKFPGDVYALGPIMAKDERRLRAWVREWMDIPRLPRGFECWTTTA